MQTTSRILLNVIFFLQALLLFLFFFEDRLSLPVWLQVAGRFHPVILHLPIGGFVICAFLVFMEGQFKRKAFRKIILVALLLTSVTASVTALLGIFISKQGDYGLEALAQHRNSGVAFSFLCYFLLLTFIYARKTLIVFSYTLGIVTLGTVILAGHTGSILTHGENYLFAPLGKSAASEGVVEGSAFSQVIYPILEQKCSSCHNRAKAKGKFVMTSMDEFVKGGKNGKEWVPGNPSESRMIQYIHLPLSDDNHMPPDGKPQLSRQETALLEQWIASGADLVKKLAEFPELDSFKIMGTAALTRVGTANGEEKAYSFSAVSDEVIQKMNTPFRSVFPLYQKSPALQADFFIKESFKPSSLKELLEVKDQLVVLNLSRMPVTDDDLEVIGTFGNLEKLNLNFSKVNGTGLSSLQSLNHLQSLSLAGTGITAANLESMLALSSLREVFVWNTKITEEEKASMAQRYPGVSLVTSLFTDDQTLRLGKPLQENDGVLKSGDRIVLRHSMPGAVIRYTLDGTNPDSLTSNLYEDPIPIASTSTIKAIACKPGWYCSEVYETTCFVEGLKPADARLLTKPDKQYPGEGSKVLTDGKKGFVEIFKEASWVGYRDDPFEAAFDFGADPPALNSIVVSYGKNVGAYIFPPEEVEVWAGRNLREAKLIKSMKIVQPVTYDLTQICALVVPLKESRHSYYKLVAKPVKKLPEWHSGKGKKGWVFVDEVFFY